MERKWKTRVAMTVAQFLPMPAVARRECANVTNTNLLGSYKSPHIVLFLILRLVRQPPSLHHPLIVVRLETGLLDWLTGCWNSEWRPRNELWDNFFWRKNGRLY